MDTHYDEAYYNWQKKICEFGGTANLFKFEKEIKPSDTVLDFGCGPGYLLKNINCSSKIGIEINPASRNKAIENGLTCYQSIDLVADESIDIVISNSALEHVPCPFDTLKKCKNKIKKNGMIAVVVPCEGASVPYVGDDINQHLYTWNPQHIGNLFNLVGFKNIKTKSIFHKWPPNYDLLQKRFGWKMFHIFATIYGHYHFRNFQVKITATKE